MTKTIEAAKADLASVVSHLRQAATDAAKRAQPGARVEFAIIAKNANGSGQVGATFECEEFLADLELVFPQSDDDRMEAEAACLVAKISRAKETL